jgi:hypothetical protein
MNQAQRFLDTHASVYNLFNLGRHLVSSENYRLFRQRVFCFLGTYSCRVESALYGFSWTQRVNLSVPKKWFDGASYPAVQAWLNGLITGEMFTKMMKKHAPWRQGQVRVLLLE